MLLGGASGEESTWQCRICKKCKFDPWVGKIPWRRWYGKPLQYSCLENPTDRGTWRVTVRGVTNSWTQLKWLTTHAQKQFTSWGELSLPLKVVISEDPQPKSHGKSLKNSNVLLCSVSGCQQSILKEINPEYSLKGPIQKVKPLYLGHLMWRANSL